MHIRRALWGVTAASVLGLLACSGGKGATKSDGSSGSSGSDSVSQTRKGNEKITEFDLNHDKKPDVWSFTVVSKGDDGREFDRLVRKELDINWDSKVDITRLYADNEQIERELLDLDFDGKVDQTNFYEKGIVVRKERDLDYNGRSDLWIFFEKGKIVRKERDSNGDAKIDYREYWEAEQVDRGGEDLDGDGNVGRWTKNPNSES